MVRARRKERLNVTNFSCFSRFSSRVYLSSVYGETTLAYFSLTLLLIYLIGAYIYLSISLSFNIFRYIAKAAKPANSAKVPVRLPLGLTARQRVLAIVTSVTIVTRLSAAASARPYEDPAPPRRVRGRRVFRHGPLVDLEFALDFPHRADRLRAVSEMARTTEQ